MGEVVEACGAKMVGARTRRVGKEGGMEGNQISSDLGYDNVNNCISFELTMGTTSGLFVVFSNPCVGRLRKESNLTNEPHVETM